MPRKIEFKELTQNVNYSIVGFGGVFEFIFGFNPVEELEGSFVVVAVTGERFKDRGFVEVK